jgi:undecaprenyl-diphosphatase
MDYLIFQSINNWAGKHSLLDYLAVFCAEYLGYILVAVLIALFLKDRQKYQSLIIKALSAVILSRLLITEIIRFFYPKLRPFMAHNDVHLLLNHSTSPSFPSGHASFFFALSAIVYFWDKKIGSWFLAASCLIAFFRVFAGVHWPSDVLAGATVGIFSAWAIEKLFSKGELKTP